MKAPGMTRTRRTFFAPIWVALLSAVVLTVLLLVAVRVSLYLFSTSTTVVLVRHAEKATPESGSDPVLSAEGQERALRLARLLGESDVAAVYASDTRRAQLTAAPLAARLGVSVTTRAGADIEGVLQDIGEHHQGERVVVVGHSNTVPALIEELTRGRAEVTLAEDEYDAVYVVTVTRFGPPSVLRLRY
jgi:2,3-bisphosphoglycerate-dependent phosphoglycerate mutase